MTKKSKKKSNIHVGNQFILTITGIARDKDGNEFYECNQFSENSMMSREELDNMIPVTDDVLCYTNGFAVGYAKGYQDATKERNEYFRDYLCQMFERKEDSDKVEDEGGEQ